MVGSRRSHSHLRFCAILPCSSVTLSGAPAACTHETCCKAKPPAHNNMRPSAAQIRHACVPTSSNTSQPALKAAASEMPYTPSTGPTPASGPSIWLYPRLSQGKPVKNQPRTHSASTHATGKIARSLLRHAASVSCGNTRATKSPSTPGNKARNATNKLVRNSERLSDTPPLSYMLTNTQLTPRPNLSLIHYSAPP